MAEALRDRLVPSLLDRLADDDPGKKTEAREFRVLSLAQLRRSVLRDLAWLFNATRIEVTDPDAEYPGDDLSDFPEVRRSVVNYGLPSMSGKTISATDLRALERSIRQAIMDFEPRLLPESLRVSAVLDDATDTHNVISFKIEARLWAQPAPIELLVRTDLDLESGQTKVTESGR